MVTCIYSVDPTYVWKMVQWLPLSAATRCLNIWIHAIHKHTVIGHG